MQYRLPGMAGSLTRILCSLPVEREQNGTTFDAHELEVFSPVILIGARASSNASELVTVFAVGFPAVQIGNVQAVHLFAFGFFSGGSIAIQFSSVAAALALMLRLSPLAS